MLPPSSHGEWRPAHTAANAVDTWQTSSHQRKYHHLRHVAVSNKEQRLTPQLQTKCGCSRQHQGHDISFLQLTGRPWIVRQLCPTQQPTPCSCGLRPPTDSGTHGFSVSQALPSCGRRGHVASFLPPTTAATDLPSVKSHIVTDALDMLPPSCHRGRRPPHTAANAVDTWPPSSHQQQCRHLRHLAVANKEQRMRPQLQRKCRGSLHNQGHKISFFSLTGAPTDRQSAVPHAAIDAFDMWPPTNNGAHRFPASQVPRSYWRRGHVASVLPPMVAPTTFPSAKHPAVANAVDAWHLSSHGR